ncbi:MAG: RagB/SusD family nutrient uptake outer membrane protein [Bacteroidetes bacterium]|nr:RagB/SusD family nutrient uptake outer membrane protein [Bacteroidota bacterium]
MKTIIKSCLLYSIILLMGSCESFLEEDPKGKQMEETFYNTNIEAFDGLMGLYSKVTNDNNGLRQNFITRSEACSDLLTYKTVGAADGQSFPKYKLTPENTPLVQIWNHCYSAIYGVNSYIAALSSNTSPKISPEKKEQYMKEAKFFRALLYYYLVGFWGDVPLRTEPTNMQNTKIIRTPATQVWAQVIQDLTDASTLPERKDTPNGRVSKGAVLTLLSKVYLMKNDFNSAKQILDQISGYSLMADISDVWSTQHKYNNESIWELNIESGTLPMQGSAMLSYFLPMYKDFKGANATYPVNDYLLMMTEKNSPRTKLFYSKKPLSSQVTSKYKGEYTYTTDLGVLKTIIFTNATEPLYSHIMKFTDFSTVGPKFEINNCPFNLIVYRYADVVLMKAEVECELNGATNIALGYLNQIRKRAGETQYSLTNEKGLHQLNNQSEMREAIRNERALELVGEGHRFFDLKRWGNEYALAKLKASRQAQIQGTTFCYQPEDLTNIEEYRLQWPIPEGEINGNSLIKQNPGY